MSMPYWLQEKIRCHSPVPRQPPSPANFIVGGQSPATTRPSAPVPAMAVGKRCWSAVMSWHSSTTLHLQSDADHGGAIANSQHLAIGGMQRPSDRAQKSLIHRAAQRLKRQEMAPEHPERILGLLGVHSPRSETTIAIGPMARATSATGAQHRPYRHSRPVDHRGIQSRPAQRIQRLQPGPAIPMGHMHRPYAGEAERNERAAT